MDYRALQPVLQPGKSRKTPSGKFVKAEEPLTIQTPRARCSYADGCLRLHFNPAACQPHAEYVGWLQDLESQCPATDNAVPTVGPSGDMRVMLFGPVPWFDASGKYVGADPPEDLRGAAVLLDLQGWWVTNEGKSGLRWKAVQVRACEPPDAAYPFLFRDTPTLTTANSAASFWFRE